MSFIKILVIATLCLAIVFTLYGPSRFLEQLWGNPDMGYVELKSLNRTSKPNTALACPPNHCSSQRPADITTGIYTVTSDVLRNDIIEYFDNDKNAKLVSNHEDDLSLRFVTHSPVLRFPDTIHIEFIPIDSDTSTLAIFAQAKLGHTDLGANKARIEQILVAISKYTQPE